MYNLTHRRLHLLLNFYSRWPRYHVISDKRTVDLVWCTLFLEYGRPLPDTSYIHNGGQVQRADIWILNPRSSTNLCIHDYDSPSALTTLLIGDNVTG